MARKVRHKDLENRTNRLKLEVARKPYWVSLGDGLGLGYRRNKKLGGNWVARKADGNGGYAWNDTFASADDFDDSNGVNVLDWWQAQDRARQIATGGTEAAPLPTASDGTKKPKTVDQAIAEYIAELESRGADASSVKKLQREMPLGLRHKHVSLLGAEELRAYRTALLGKRSLKGGRSDGKRRTPATVNRLCTSIKAALNRAASLDSKRITNSAEWETGLATLPDAERPRNVIITDQGVITRIIEACYQDDKGIDLGLLAEVCAETGTRCSQAARLLVDDFKPGKKPLLMMPTSKKGRGTKLISRHPTPITPGLAHRLQQAASGRGPNERLLLTYEGKPWGKSVHNRRFRDAVKRAGLKGISIIAFRHSSIVRQLLDGLPTRVVAVNHDTSVVMIERNYSAHIGSHTDEITRATLVNFVNTRRGNVIDIFPRRGR